jgi:deazaflavin-dependent oxidoreductase (nitroreductase family)
LGDDGQAAAGTTRNQGDSSTMPLTGEYEPSTSDWAREQTELFEQSGGTEGNTLRGMPIIVMTSVGARSGKLRKTPLMRVEQGGEYAVVASLGGAPKHPVWYHNLKKNPHVELQDGPVKHDYLAREVTGEEKAAWWERAVAAYPDYADYQKKTTREIPVFVLSPM